MIDESLITEYNGTTFSVEKVDGVSQLTFANNSDHVIANIERGAVVFAGDCSDCGAYTALYENATWDNILVIGLGLGVLPQYIKENKSPTVIDVLDDNSDLISYVNFLDSNINIIEGDAYTYTPNKKYDIIIVDLYWNESEVTAEMKTNLINNYSSHLESGGIIVLPISGIILE